MKNEIKTSESLFALRYKIFNTSSLEKTMEIEGVRWAIKFFMTYQIFYGLGDKTQFVVEKAV